MGTSDGGVRGWSRGGCSKLGDSGEEAIDVEADGGVADNRGGNVDGKFGARVHGDLGSRIGFLGELDFELRVFEVVDVDLGVASVDLAVCCHR